MKSSVIVNGHENTPLSVYRVTKQHSSCSKYLMSCSHNRLSDRRSSIATFASLSCALCTPYALCYGSVAKRTDTAEMLSSLNQVRIEPSCVSMRGPSLQGARLVFSLHSKES